MIIIMIKIINDNIVYKLGKNAKENFILIDEANDINSDYWWFHLEDHPSGHCIVHDKNIDKSSVICRITCQISFKIEKSKESQNNLCSNKRYRENKNIRRGCIKSKAKCNNYIKNINLEKLF